MHLDTTVLLALHSSPARMGAKLREQFVSVVMMGSWYPKICRAVLYNVSAAVEVLKRHDDASARPQQRPQPTIRFSTEAGSKKRLKRTHIYVVSPRQANCLLVKSSDCALVAS